MTSQQILKQYFGYDSFRSGQDELITDVLSGKDVLGIMPTGAGKSLCFQVPALMLDGITLIISPLISLMKDQVNALTQSGVTAAFINSSLTERQINIALDNARNGTYKIIYIAPERLLSPSFLEFSRSAKISMLTVDEAHCISQWGQDFRSSYVKIPEFINSLETRPIVSAFTATATKRVRDDIIELLDLHDPTILVTGFDRPNLHFQVVQARKKYAALADFLEDKKEQSGIVYCSTRAAVEEVCDELNNNGYQASRYHAGLPDSERHNNQDDFLYDRAKIMVATNAFGMGIDKSNVSFVVHYNMPKDIESYYQEAGRAGRDGEAAHCILLYSGRDVRTNLWMIENARDTQYADAETEEMLKERDRKRLREMTFYCTTNECLRAYILKYFGETPPNYCGNCSSCNDSYETVDVTTESQKILSCVGRMKERFGVNLIIDVLRGSKNDRVLRLELDKLSTYGISEKNEKQLRDIINHLILNDYLMKTDDEFPLVKLGAKAKEVLFGNVTVEMKLSTQTQEEKATKTKREKDTKRIPVNNELLTILKALRLEIANEQKVPAFVIFADSSLTDMCMKMPLNEEEMLKVSGVGRVKLERHGQRFLEAIAEFASTNQVEQVKEEPSKELDVSTIEITDDKVSISVIADRINCVIMQSGYKKVSGQKVNDWLVSKNFMEVIVQNGKNYKVPTNQGVGYEISSEERNIRGIDVLTNLYGRKVQEVIVDNVLEIVAFEK